MTDNYKRQDRGTIASCSSSLQATSAKGKGESRGNQGVKFSNFGPSEPHSAISANGVGSLAVSVHFRRSEDAASSPIKREYGVPPWNIREVFATRGRFPSPTPKRR